MHNRVDSRPIVTDGRILGEIDQLRNALRLAQSAEKYDPQGLADQSPRLERQLWELAERAANEATLITLEALPAEVFDAIARLYPPRPDQLERWRLQAEVFPMAELPEWDDVGMAPALLEACMTEPVWDPTWWAGLSRGVQKQLWSRAINVQMRGADLPFYNAATATTGDGGEPSTMHANGAYPLVNS